MSEHNLKVATRSSKPGSIDQFTKRVIDCKTFAFEGWQISLTKSTILPSNCYCATLNVKQEGIEGGFSDVPNETCQVCRFEKEVKLTHLPEMVFPDNRLRLEYKESGFVLDFNVIDALEHIQERPTETIRVACADEWTAAQTQDNKDLPSHVQYDWTYSTSYKGTLVSSQGSEGQLCAQATTEKLNLGKLKLQEKILFFEELNLYEDELHDHGTSNLSLKIRIMPSGFFILLRFFLRVDKVLFKIRDTRIYFEVGKTYFLREFQERRQTADALAHLPMQKLIDPNFLYTHLPVVEEYTETINFT